MVILIPHPMKVNIFFCLREIWRSGKAKTGSSHSVIRALRGEEASMELERLKGCWTAMVTPFNRKGELLIWVSFGFL